MAIGIRPTVDYAFKLLFGSPEHVRVTIHFLNAILGHVPRITDVTIQNPFLGKADEHDKLSVLDIRAIDQHGRQLNIEMQSTLPAGMTQRLIYYNARMYGGQLNEGDQYTGLCPAISICVMEQALLPERPELHLDFQLRTSDGQLLSDDMQVHLLQLPKLRVTAENVSKASAMEQWAYFMRNAEKLTLVEVTQIFTDQEFAEAAGVLEMISQTPEQQQLYDARLKFQLDEAARLEFARTEGIREGEVRGRTEGLRIGELIGQIKLLQNLLGISNPPSEEISSYNMVELSELADQLQAQLRRRSS